MKRLRYMDIAQLIERLQDSRIVGTIHHRGYGIIYEEYGKDIAKIFFRQEHSTIDAEISAPEDMQLMLTRQALALGEIVQLPICC